MLMHPESPLWRSSKPRDQQPGVISVRNPDIIGEPCQFSNPVSPIRSERRADPKSRGLVGIDRASENKPRGMFSPPSPLKAPPKDVLAWSAIRAERELPVEPRLIRLHCIGLSRLQLQTRAVPMLSRLDSEPS